MTDTTNTQNTNDDPRAIAQSNIKSRENIAAMGIPAEDLAQGTSSVKDIIAPAAFVVNSNYLQIGSLFTKTLFVFTYPRYIETNWLSPIINYDITIDVGMHIHPLESKDVMTDLKKQVGKIESSMMIGQEKGAPRDPEMETALGDVEALRDVLQRGEVRLFHFGLYFTIYDSSLEELKTVTEQLESTLGGLLIYTKEALFQMEQGFTSTLPLMVD